MAVTRQPCKVGDDGIPRLREPIEERRLAHIGAPYQGNNWLHYQKYLLGSARACKPGQIMLINPA
jgi:hypothetical protein